MLRRAVAAVAVAIISPQWVGVREWRGVPEWVPGEASGRLAGTGVAETGAATGKAETGAVVAIGVMVATGAMAAIGMAGTITMVIM